MSACSPGICSDEEDLVTLPALIFSFLVASLFGSLLHVWRDGGFGRLILYLVLSWLGFGFGHILAEALSISFLDVGPIHLGMGILGTLIFLGFGYWLSLVDLSNT
jgi:hypothetical protein